jgi:hypothetical protein
MPSWRGRGNAPCPAWQASSLLPRTLNTVFSSTRMMEPTGVPKRRPINTTRGALQRTEF